MNLTIPTPAAVVTWIKALPPWVRWGVIIAAVAAAAFSAGRFSAPLKVEEHTKIETKTEIVYQDRIVEKRIEVQAAAKIETRIVYRDRVITPDGTLTEHEIEKTGAITETEAKTESAKTEEKSEAKAEEKTEEITKKTESRPDWRVAVTAGASLTAPLLPIAGPLVLGAEFDRRIVGGLSLGVWVSTQGSAGAAVALEF